MSKSADLPKYSRLTGLTEEEKKKRARLQRLESAKKYRLNNPDKVKENKKRCLQKKKMKKEKNEILEHMILLQQRLEEIDDFLNDNN